MIYLNKETVQVESYAPEEKSLHLKLDIEREIEMRNIVEVKEVFKTIDKEEILSGINCYIW